MLHYELYWILSKEEGDNDRYHLLKENTGESLNPWLLRQAVFQSQPS